MKYQWDIYELRKNIGTLESMLKHTSDKDETELIRKNISQFRYMMEIGFKKYYKENDIDIKLSFIESLNEYMTNYSQEQIKLANIILDTYPIIQDFTPSFDMDFSIEMTNCEILEFVTNFFQKMTDKQTNAEYQNFLNKNINELHIKSVKINSEESFGQYLFDSILKKKYIYYQRNNTILDAVILPHELFHYIFNDYDVEQVYNTELYYSTEIEGIFSNLLVSEYLKDFSEEQKFLNNYFLENYKDLATGLLFGYRAVDLINKRMFSEKTFNKGLDKLGFNHFFIKEEITDYFNEDADSNITYTIGLLVGLDLLEIYREDLEKAFYLLRNIRNERNNTNLINLLLKNEITFIDDGYSNFKKFVKTLKS